MLLSLVQAVNSHKFIHQPEVLSEFWFLFLHKKNLFYATSETLFCPYLLLCPLEKRLYSLQYYSLSVIYLTSRVSMLHRAHLAGKHTFSTLCKKMHKSAISPCFDFLLIQGFS